MVETAVILAAGEGRRNFPYTATRQKAAIPVGNRPLIEITATTLAEQGISRLLVVLGHRQERVRHALARAEAVFVEQRERNGTAPAVLEAAKHIPDGDFLVLYGDTLNAPGNIARLLEAFRASGAAAAVLLDPLRGRAARDWICGGIGDGKLTGIEGHPRGGSHRLAGAFVLTQRALPYLAANPGLVTSVPVGGMPSLEADLSQSLQMMLDDGLEVIAIEADEFVVDIDKPWQVLQANTVYARYVCERLTEADTSRGRVSDGADIEGRVALGEGAEIGRRVVIRGNVLVGRRTRITDGAMVGGNTIIGDDCRIREYCLIGGESVIGDKNVIGHGAEMFGTTFDTVYLYHYCEMAGVIGSAVDIGAATVCGNLRFDDGETAHRVLGRREVPDFASNLMYIGDYCRTGVNATIMPGVKIGPYSCIGPGVILYDDCPERTLILAKQEHVTREWGPERYGW